MYRRKFVLLYFSSNTVCFLSFFWHAYKISFNVVYVFYCTGFFLNSKTSPSFLVVICSILFSVFQNRSHVLVSRFSSTLYTLRHKKNKATYKFYLHSVEAYTFHLRHTVTSNTSCIRKLKRVEEPIFASIRKLTFEGFKLAIEYYTLANDC